MPPTREPTLTAPSTITSTDLVNEAIAGLFSRPTRTLLTVLGTMIGLTALVATLGLSRTAGNQIVGRFDEIAATEVDVSSRPVDFTDQPNELPWDASARLEGLNGVVAAGAMGKVDVGNAFVRTVPLNDPARQTEFKLAVQGMTPSMFEAVRAKLLAGRFFDAGHSLRADRVAVIGKNAAKDLGIDRLEPLPAIQIGDDPFLVIGIVDDVARVDKLMSSVMIPEGTAQVLYHLRVPDTVVIETEIGANGLIAEQAPIALRPDNPDGLKVTAQPELTQVRESVSGDLDLLFLMLGGVSLLVGAIGIANVTLVSVMERTGEIGLRHALGATRRHVAQQFLVESTAMGLVGGILGASLGILIVVLVSAIQGWTAVVDPVHPVRRADHRRSHRARGRQLPGTPRGEHGARGGAPRWYLITGDLGRCNNLRPRRPIPGPRGWTHHDTYGPTRPRDHGDRDRVRARDRGRRRPRAQAPSSSVRRSSA